MGGGGGGEGGRGVPGMRCLLAPRMALRFSKTVKMRPMTARPTMWRNPTHSHESSMISSKTRGVWALCVIVWGVGTGGVWGWARRRVGREETVGQTNRQTQLVVVDVVDVVDVVEARSLVES